MSKYSALSIEEQNELLSNYLISHWSVSGVRSFARNEKDFERSYIFGERSSVKGLSAHVGTVYHNTLQEFFLHWKASEKVMSFDEMAMVAHRELKSIGANEYKEAKSKTIQEQQNDALKYVNSLVKNFLKEVDSYLDDIQEIVMIETPLIEWITLDGIDIPVPLKGVPDLVYINKEGYLCISDHKSKKSYTPESDVHVNCSKQSTAYACLVDENIKRPEWKPLIEKYPKIKEGVKFFRYYENKYTVNRDGSRQIRCITIEINETRPVYEALLMEGVQRMMEAVSNPDYVYLINEDDKFQNAEETFDFWVKTKLEGLDGFPNLKEKQKKILSKRKQAIRRSAISPPPKAMITAFKKQAGFISFNNADMTDLSLKERIEHRLRCFNFSAEVAHQIEGYSCDTFLLQVGVGVKINQIFGYRMDIANAAGVPDVRILNSLVQYGDNSYISVEINKKERKPLLMSPENLPTGDFKFPIGRDNFNNEVVWDIGNPSTPHLLVAGASGSGKSVALTTIIEAALKKGMKVGILDPKFEFVDLDGRDGVTVVNGQDEVEAFMAEKVAEMDEIYQNKGAKGNTNNKQLIVFDEASDCFTRQRRPGKGEDFKTLEDNTLLLAQKARSAGIHMVLSSQRFSVKVMTGDAKANFPTRLCLTVASAVDSKVMLDEDGAEKLNGKGDALYRSPEMGEPVRIQTYMMK